MEKTDALHMLEADHKKVKGLFSEFEDAKTDAACLRAAKEAIHDLKIHAAIEEEIFYPAVEEAIDDDEDLVTEAREEHHVAKTLISELDAMSGEEDNYCAKFTVLAENIRHHIKEEEGELFPKVKKSDLDLEELGRQMADRKAALRGGMPEPEEAHAGGRHNKKGRS